MSRRIERCLQILKHAALLDGRISARAPGTPLPTPTLWAPNDVLAADYLVSAACFKDSAPRKIFSLVLMAAESGGYKRTQQKAKVSGSDARAGKCSEADRISKT